MRDGKETMRRAEAEENPYLPYQITEPRVLRRFPDADSAFEGRLIGGCLDCLVNILGTKYDGTVDFVEKYKEDGFVWFLEACDLNVFAIRRAIWQMEPRRLVPICERLSDWPPAAVRTEIRGTRPVPRRDGSAWKIQRADRDGSRHRTPSSGDAADRRKLCEGGRGRK